MAHIEEAPGGGAGERRWTLHLPPSEAALLVALPERLAGLLANPDGNRRIIQRLFPVSYSDEQQEREHRRLLGESLLDSRRELIEAVRALLTTARRTRRGLVLLLSAAAIDQLLRFVNDMRLVLATELGIEQNLGDIDVKPGDPDAPRYALLVYLGGIESLLVESLIGEQGF